MDSNINRKDIKLSQVSLEQIIEEVFEQLKPEIEEKGTEVTFDKPRPKATGHLLQSVTNLVRNAINCVSSKSDPRSGYGLKKGTNTYAYCPLAFDYMLETVKTLNLYCFILNKMPEMS